MSTGVPIYLVSACNTGEEFVAAFRRYADRSGLFIPMADPIPVGKKGRFAVTLNDGGVMVEGEAEVVSSTRTPSVLHGRIGMTLRFGEPDEPSKIVLVELEKARLSMKPPPPSVPPRPADIPPEPRAVPPPPAGRIDANNALAECVAIGDFGMLEAAAAPSKPNTKFVMPSVAPVPESQRSRTPSGPPPMHIRPKQPTNPPATPGGTGPIARPKQPTNPGGIATAAKPGQTGPVTAPTPSVKATQPSAVVPPPPMPAIPRGPAGTSGPISAPRSPTMALPALLRTPAGGIPSGVAPAVVPSRAPAPAKPGGGLSDDVIGFGFEAARPHRQIGPIRTVDDVDDEPAVVSSKKPSTIDDDLAPAGVRPSSVIPVVAAAPRPVPAAPIVAAARGVQSPGIEFDEPTDLTDVPPEPPPAPLRAESPTGVDDGVPVQLPAGKSRPTSNRMTTIAGNEPLRKPAAPATKTGPFAKVATPPALQTGPVAKLVAPQTGPIAKVAPPAPVPVPAPQADTSGRIPRRTVLGIAVVPDGMTVLPAPSAPTGQDHDTGIITAPPPPPSSAPTIEEPTPSGNWTFTPGDDKPTIEPRKPEPKPIPAGPPTGDWSIAVLPESPDGWSEPSKIEKRPHTVPGPPEATVSGSRSYDARAQSQPIFTPEEPKVQIDSTLIEPLMQMPADVSLTDLGASDPSAPTAKLPMGAMPGAPLPLTPSASTSSGIPRVSSQGEASYISGPVSQPVAALALPGMPPALPSAYAPLPGTMPSATGPQSVHPGFAPGASMQGMSYPPRAATNAGDFGFADGGFAAPKKSRLPLVIIGVLLVIAAGVLVFVLVSHGKHAVTGPTPTVPTEGSAKVSPTVPDQTAVAPPSTGSATPPPEDNGSAGSAEAQVAVDDGSADAGSAEVAVAAGSADHTAVAKPVVPPDDQGSAAVAVAVATPTGNCPVDIDTSPGAVDILVAGDEIGTTPATVQLPCGVAVKIVLRKARYTSVVRTITPTPKSKIRMKLEKITYVVKLSSSPPGATVSVAGKSIGVTPTTARLPAMEGETIVFSKVGYASESQKFTAKQNNQTVHQVLKKKGK